MKLTQGAFSFLPDLTDEQITKQIQYAIDKSWAISIEYTDEDNVAREVKEVLRNSFISNENVDYDYTIQITVSESQTPLIINVNGTVAKYSIEITINYDVIGTNNDLIYSDTVRGFSQYNVGTSEIDNRQKKIEMVRAATFDAVQIMISKIQSTVVSSDDN